MTTATGANDTSGGATGAPGDAATAGRLPFVVYLLALGTFLMCTTEFLIAGLLPEIAADFGLGLAQTGLLITAFALGMIVGAPTLALATARLPQRATLVVALLVFALGHVLAAISTEFNVVLAARVVTALVTGAFWSVASAVGTAAAGPTRSSKALGVMMSGVGLATVVGVPVGSLAGQHLGWRGTFWALAVLAGVAALVIARFAPADGSRAGASVRSQLTVLRAPRLWLLLLATVFVTGGYMATFSYISPLLTEHAGFSPDSVPLVLVGFGVGSLIGTNVSGRMADRRPIATYLAAAVSTIAIMAMIVTASGNGIIAIALVVLLGVAGMAVPPVATGLAVRYAAAAPSFAAGLAVAAFNGGIALGSWIAGHALDSRLGATGPALIGVVMAGVGVAPLLVLAIARRGASSPVAHPEPARPTRDPLSA